MTVCKSEQPAGFEWRQFLNLGERLLKQPDAAAQCTLIEQHILASLEIKARVWLQHPCYPLPGEPSVALLSDPGVPEVIIRALQNCQTCLQTEIDPLNPQTQYLAVPLTTQDTLLGVLQAEKPFPQLFEHDETSYLEELAAFAALAMQTSRQIKLKNWRNEQLHLVRSVSSQIVNLSDPDELCQKVTDLIHNTFHYYSISIFTYDQAREVLRLRANTGHSQTTYPVNFLVPVGQGIIGWVGQTMNELIAPDVQVEPHFLPWLKLPETASEYTLPLKVENRLLGVLDIQSNQFDAFHENDRLVLGSLAEFIALALEGSDLTHNLRRRVEQISAVQEISRAISSILDSDRLINQVADVIQRRFGFPFVHIYIYNAGQKKIRFHSASGMYKKEMAARSPTYDLDSPEGLIPAAARNRKTILARNVSSDPLYIPPVVEPDITSSELVIPLVYGDDLLGILDIQSDQVDAFDPHEIPIFESLAGSIAISIRNADLYRSVKWRHQVAVSFQDVSGMLVSDIPIENLLDTILVRLDENLPCEAAAIWLLEPNAAARDMSDSTAIRQQDLRLMAARGIDPQKLKSHYARSTSVHSWLDNVLKSALLHIRTAAEPLDPLGEALGLSSDSSSISSLLRAGGKTLGLLTMIHRQPGKYGNEASAITSTFANYAAAAILNARLFADAQEQAWVSHMLLQAAEAARNVTSSDELFSALSGLAQMLPRVRKIGFFSWMEEGQYFHLQTWHGFSSPTPNQLFPIHSTPAFAQLVQLQTTINLQNPGTALHLSDSGNAFDNENTVLLPLIAHGHLQGACLVSFLDKDAAGSGSTPPESLDRRAFPVLQGIAHEAATALENMRLTEARQEEAYVTAVLLQAAQAVASQNDLSDTLDTVVHLLPILVGIDACIIYLWNEDDHCFEPAAAHSNRHRAESPAFLESFAPGQFQLLDMVFESGHLHHCILLKPVDKPLEWASSTSLPISGLPEQLPAAGTGWILGFPISPQSKTRGVLITPETNVPPSILHKRIEMISGITQQVAIAIQNEKNKQQIVERERMDREFQLARQIQQNFLPDQLPVIPGWQVAALWQTAREVGGDFYDIFYLPDGRLCLVIADVSDKGIPAALYMTVTRTLIRANLHNAPSPASVLKLVNRFLYHDSQNGMFITAILSFLDPATGKMICSNTGHNRPLWMHTRGESIETLPKGSIALGVVEEIDPADEQIKLESGDTIIFYTDGVTDTFSPSGENFGVQRLTGILSENFGAPPETLLEAIDKTLSGFRQNFPPDDDITLLAIRYSPS